jgi:hypothetical protein
LPRYRLSISPDPVSDDSVEGINHVDANQILLPFVPHHQVFLEKEGWMDLEGLLSVLIPLGVFGVVVGVLVLFDG